MTVDLRAVYDRFFELGGPPQQDKDRKWRYRRKVTSLGWPTVRFIGSLVEERHPQRVLDLGSGLTSIVLRSLARENGMRVVSTDTSHGWILKTILECRRDGLDDTEFYMHGTFEASEQARTPFDLIVVDIADTPFRRELSSKLPGWLAPHGVIVLDDWHKEPYASTMTTRLQELGFVVEPCPETRDEFGRFAAIATQPASTITVPDWEWPDDE